MSRESGWYRVKHQGVWEFAEFESSRIVQGGFWWLSSMNDPVAESDLDEIDETPVNPVPADEITEYASIAFDGFPRNTYPSVKEALEDCKKIVALDWAKKAEVHVIVIETRVVKEGDLWFKV